MSSESIALLLKLKKTIKTKMNNEQRTKDIDYNIQKSVIYANCTFAKYH